MGRLTVSFIVAAFALVLQSPNARVPFVGCPSDGQTGPVDAPKSSHVEVR